LLPRRFSPRRQARDLSAQLHPGRAKLSRPRSHPISHHTRREAALFNSSTRTSLRISGRHGSERRSESQLPTEPAAEALGVNLYAKQCVNGCNRQELERLCRYVMRPALSQERLEWRSDGRLELTLKNVWKDGTRALALEPHDLLVRLCATIPPPWFNMVRYFGVLSSHSRHRARVVAS